MVRSESEGWTERRRFNVKLSSNTIQHVTWRRPWLIVDRDLRGRSHGLIHGVIHGSIQYTFHYPPSPHNGSRPIHMVQVASLSMALRGPGDSLSFKDQPPPPTHFPTLLLMSQQISPFDDPEVPPPPKHNLRRSPVICRLYTSRSPRYVNIGRVYFVIALRNMPKNTRYTLSSLQSYPRCQRSHVPLTVTALLRRSAGHFYFLILSVASSTRQRSGVTNSPPCPSTRTLVSNTLQ